MPWVGSPVSFRVLGFTSNTGVVYVLAEPVEITQGDITLRLKNAVSDDARFWTDLTVQGATGQEFKAEAFQAFVLMPDGKMLQFKSGTKNSTQLSFSFPALPPGTQALSLYVVNLEGQNFNLALRLRPVKSGEIIPVQPTGDSPAAIGKCQRPAPGAGSYRARQR